jgi:hypothetical protein
MSGVLEELMDTFDSRQIPMSENEAEDLLETVHQAWLAASDRHVQSAAKTKSKGCP